MTSELTLLLATLSVLTGAFVNTGVPGPALVTSSVHSPVLPATLCEAVNP